MEGSILAKWYLKKKLNPKGRLQWENFEKKNYISRICSPKALAIWLHRLISISPPIDQQKSIYLLRLFFDHQNS